MAAALELKGISKNFGVQEVLKDISLVLEPGKFYGLVGSNGAGKSTLLKVIMRLEKADRGMGLVYGELLSEDSSEINHYMALASDALQFTMPLTIEQLFDTIAPLYPKWDWNIFQSLVEIGGVDLGRSTSALSRGQQMQVVFAMAAATQPKILLVDEITSVVDPNVRMFYVDYLGKYVEQGGTVLMATNILTELKDVADHLLLLHEGQLRVDLSIAEIPKSYVKIRRPVGKDHPIFKNPECIPVVMNSDQSVSFVIWAEALRKSRLPEEFIDKRATTPEDLFLYFSRAQAR